MDGLKLTKWQEDFEKEADTLQTQYDAFLLPKKFSDTYHFEITSSQWLELVIEKDSLPKEIEDRLVDMFNRAQPEDSV
jgi:hypothetical protein